MRLIEANALLLHQRRAIMFYPSGEANEAVVTVAEINNAPTIEAEPVKHGRWVEAVRWIRTDGHKKSLRWKRCSNCGFRVKPKFAKNYCPNCGAKMDLED